mgnify:FL=1
MPLTRRVDPLLLIDDVATYLQGLGLGTKQQTLFLLTLPATPVVCRSIHLTGWPPPYALDYQRFQVLVRDTDITSAHAIAQRIWVALDQKKPDLPRFAGWTAADHPVGPRWYDQNNLPVYTMNFLFTGTVRVI